MGGGGLPIRGNEQSSVDVEGWRGGEVWRCLGECETVKASRDDGRSSQFQREVSSTCR